MFLIAGSVKRGSDVSQKKKKKKKWKVKPYTLLGKRIAALESTQRKLADVMGVTQQTISHKLLGRSAIFVTDLEKFARHYKVPMTYFFEDWKP